MIRRLSLVLLPFLLVIATARAADTPLQLTSPQITLVDHAKELGVTDIAVTAAPDGGFILGGKLEGDQFALAFPANWPGDALLYAHGYSTPGTPVAVAADPIAGGTGTGLLGEAYAQGMAVGHSAYGKAGLGVQTGVLNTKRLRDFVASLGGKRIYIMGDSMGGGIVVTLLEQYPDAFAGGLARCGAVNSWQDLIAGVMDMRLAYNALTKGTPYELPGEQDVRRNAIAPEPPPGTPDALAQVYVAQQLAKVATPILTLWAAAQKDPNGIEAKIAHAVTAIGRYNYDAGSLAYPLITAALGAEDMATTTGGWVYGNVGKVYEAPELSSEEQVALNRDIQRVEASPEALAYLQEWHTATGNIATPLVTLHNRIDPLVPYAQEAGLAEAIKRAGHEQFIMQYDVPPVKEPLLVGSIEGYTHCGFDKAQTLAAWSVLRHWAETGVRPTKEVLL